MRKICVYLLSPIWFGLLSPILFTPIPAQAQKLRSEIWAASEVILTLSPETDPNLAWHDIIPDGFRLYTELQEAPNFPDIHQLLWRMGPIWNLSPHFSFSTHFSNAAVQNLETRSFIEEHRLEFEPLFRGKLLPWLSWANRHRLEYRIRVGSQRWRYRNRFALSVEESDRNWIPFISSEFFFDLSEEGLNQNRTTLGISWQLNPSIRLNLSYMIRFVKIQNLWDPIQVAFISLTYTSREGGIFQMQSD